MPYALFSNEARLSKTYPTEADVWKLARRSGLVVDWPRMRKNRRPGRCSTMTMKSEPAAQNHRKTPPGTRLKPNARPNLNSG